MKGQDEDHLLLLTGDHAGKGQRGVSCSDHDVFVPPDSSLAFTFTLGGGPTGCCVESTAQDPHSNKRYLANRQEVLLPDWCQHNVYTLEVSITDRAGNLYRQRIRVNPPMPVARTSSAAAISANQEVDEDEPSDTDFRMSVDASAAWESPAHQDSSAATPVGSRGGKHDGTRIRSVKAKHTSGCDSSILVERSGGFISKEAEEEEEAALSGEHRSGDAENCQTGSCIPAPFFRSVTHSNEEVGGEESRVPQGALDTIHKNRGARERSDELAVEWWTKAARQGHVEAQYGLGRMHFKGRGVSRQSDELAVKWWTKAASQGHDHAQFDLGLMYFHGRGVSEQSDELAVEWWTKAAIQGRASAQYNLGKMYDWGRGVSEQSDELAIKWWTKAARQGHASSQYNLGRMYEQGRGGIEQSSELAIEWWTKAALQDHVPAQRNLGRMCERGL